MSHPNVIFIITDDQGYGDVDLQGTPVLQAPNLGRGAIPSCKCYPHAFSGGQRQRIGIARSLQ